MALDFQGLQTEFFARGFDYMNDAGAQLVRAKRWINDATHEVDRLQRWDYARATSTGAAPLTIADLRDVGSVVVVSTGWPLVEAQKDVLSDAYVDLTTVGSAVYWYRSAVQTIAVFPVSTSPISVSYFKVAPDMVANADAPLMPDEYRMVIVELAVRRAFRDNAAWESAADALVEANRIIGDMRNSLVSLPRFCVTSGEAVDA